MKIAYVANARIPTEKAHGFQIAKMCEQFARAGADVTLFVPKRQNSIAQDAFSYYEIERNFKVEFVPCADTVGLSRFVGGIAYLLQTRLFLRSLARMGERGIAPDAVVYTRTPEAVRFFTKRGNPAFYDAHSFPERGSSRLLSNIRDARGIVANSKGTAEEFEARGHKVLVAPNGVSVAQFEAPVDRAAVRALYGISPDARVATYVGHLYAWKGVDVVVDAAALLPDVTFLVVGGTDKDVAAYRAKASGRGLSNLVVAGHKGRKEVPAILKASDALLLPNVPVSKESGRYTSPIKLFEYMASGVPVVASDLPSIREIIDERLAALVKPGEARALAEALKVIFADSAAAKARAERARAESARYDWASRARRVLDFLKC